MMRNQFLGKSKEHPHIKSKFSLITILIFRRRKCAVSSSEDSEPDSAIEKLDGHKKKSLKETPLNGKPEIQKSSMLASTKVLGVT